MDISQTMEKIDQAIINKQHTHPSDESRVAKIFFQILKQDGNYGMDEVATLVNSLGGKYSDTIKEGIKEIAYHVLLLKD